MTPTLQELENWYTTELAAKAANRSHQGVINLAKDGKIRGVKVGRAHSDSKGCWIFDPESIRKFVEAMKDAQRHD